MKLPKREAELPTSTARANNSIQQQVTQRSSGVLSTARGKSFNESTSRTRWGKVQPPPPRKTFAKKASVGEVAGSQELMIKLLEQRVQHLDRLLKSGGLAGPPGHMQ